VKGYGLCNTRHKPDVRLYWPKDKRSNLERVPHNVWAIVAIVFLHSSWLSVDSSSQCPRLSTYPESLPLDSGCLDVAYIQQIQIGNVIQLSSITAIISLSLRRSFMCHVHCIGLHVQDIRLCRFEWHNFLLSILRTLFKVTSWNMLTSTFSVLTNTTNYKIKVINPLWLFACVPKLIIHRPTTCVRATAHVWFVDVSFNSSD